MNSDSPLNFSKEMLPWLSVPHRSAVPPPAPSLSERLVGQCLMLLAVACTSCVNGAAVAEAEVVKHSCSDVARYYQGTAGLGGERLRKKLFKIIRNHHVLPYKQVRGDIARSLMYMVIRYGLDKHMKGFHLQLSDTPNEVEKTSVYATGSLPLDDLSPVWAVAL